MAITAMPGVVNTGVATAAALEGASNSLGNAQKSFSNITSALSSRADTKAAK